MRLSRSSFTSGRAPGAYALLLALWLASADLKAENGLARPTKLAPVETGLEAASGEFVYRLAPNSFNVPRIPR